jgi:hypothetical protein
MKIDTATVAAMASAGIGFYANIRVPGGGTTIHISAEKVPQFIADPQQFAADEHGVSKEAYLRWVETDGTPQCGAQTKKGARCQNFVSGGIQRSLEDWLRLDGGYCAVHGGDASPR